MSAVGQFTPALVAGGTIRPYRFVKMSGDNTGAECDANEDAVGVSSGSVKDFTSANHAESGDQIHLQPGNIVEVEFGGTVSAGDGVKSNADGQAVAVATTGTTEQFEIGKAIHAGADTKRGRIIFQPRRFHPEIA